LLLPILEFLCATEESVVRESAVATLNSLMSKVKADVMQAKFLPMIKRLAAGEWFTTRVSVAGLFAKAYPHVKEPQQGE
jgi:serine/threonine-protein phosphatase 2A regulatory subunit A